MRLLVIGMMMGLAAAVVIDNVTLQNSVPSQETCSPALAGVSEACVLTGCADGQDSDQCVSR